MPKHKAWVPSSTLGSNMRSSNFIIVPKPNLWSLSSSVAYQDLYITPFNYDLECNGNEAVQHKSRKEHSLDQIVSRPVWSATRFAMIDAIAYCDSRANDWRAKVERSFTNNMIKCLEVFDIFNSRDTWRIGLVVDFPSWMCHFKEHLLDKVFWSGGKW